jgi:choline-sulfatase
MPPPVQPADDQHDRPRGQLDRRLEKSALDLEPADVARLRANYAGKVTLIDDQVGALLRVVEDRGELEDTVVAFVSDHGEMNGDYNLLYKHNFLNPAVRVPFIVRLPANRRTSTGGAVTETMVELMDLGATLVELAGGKHPRRSLARSVVPVLEDPSRSHREAALSEMRREHMIATPDWKLAVNREGEPYLLFDLRSDPTETRNLAAVREYGDVEERMKQLLDTTVAAAR